MASRYGRVASVAWAVILLGVVGLLAQGTPPALQPSAPKAIQAEGLHNVFVLSTNLISGSAPEGDSGFAALAKLGVKTILTVDGAQPDVERARRFGIRYVHVPHGYDGIPPEVQLRLVKAARTLPGPMYVHCHHGKHRGPVAAAVICMADGLWDSGQAEAFLTAAGTATNYAGLYRTVRDFRAPSPEMLAAVSGNFPEKAPVPGVVAAMLAVDDCWEHLKAVRKAGYRVPPSNPDLDPANEALMLWEHFREASRLPEAARRGTPFLERLSKAEAEAKQLEAALRTPTLMRVGDSDPLLDRAFDTVGATCTACHKEHRDRAVSGAR